MKHAIFALPVLAVVLTACTTRFQDNFEADTIGALPATMPDGTPDDQLSVLDLTNNTLVTGTSPITGAKSLRIGGNSSGFTPNVFMYAEPLNDPSQSVYAQWQGRISSGGHARFFFFTGHFSNMVEVELTDGVILVNDDQVGTYTAGERHLILLRASPSDDSFGFSFFADSGDHSTTGTVLNASFFPQSNIGLTAQLVSPNTSDSYVMDSVGMSERNPPDDASG